MSKATKTIEMNKGDWSGERTQLSINSEEMLLWVHEYRFRLEKEPWDLEDEYGRIFKIWSDDGSWDHPLGTVHESIDKRNSGKRHFEAGDGYITRDDETIFVAAAQYLFNVI